MKSNKRIRASIGLASSLALVALAGCYDNESSAFPNGLGPWSDNDAPMPTAEGGDPCPETIAFGPEDTFHGTNAAGASYESNSVHARACIHQPASVVWEALQDPLVGRDQTTVNSFSVIDPPNPEECDGLYQSQINAGSPFSVDFRLCWRMGVIEGTDDAPTLVAARWQKVWGTSILKVMEGSVLLYPFEGDPSITVVEYEYHLNSIGSDYGTIRTYLGVLYGRLADRAHGRPLP